MPYTFTPAQQAEITLRFNQSPMPNQPGNFSLMYGYIGQVLSTPQPSIGNVRPDIDPIVLGSRLWFSGAFYANGGTGAPSRLIREFTQTQGVLHNGQPFPVGTGPLGIQEASNNVSRNIYSDIQAQPIAPTVNSLGSRDARAVGTTLFTPTVGALDSAGDETINAAWAGTLLIQFLRRPGVAEDTDQTLQLVKKGPSLVDADVMDDWRNLLFAQHSFEVGTAAVLRNSFNDVLSASWAESFNGLDENGATAVSIEAGNYSRITGVALTNVVKNSAVADDYQAISALPVQRSLDLFRSAQIGTLQTGTRIENFTDKARGFFITDIGRVPGQNLSTVFRPTGILAIDAQVPSNLEAR